MHLLSCWCRTERCCPVVKAKFIIHCMTAAEGVARVTVFYEYTMGFSVENESMTAIVEGRGK